jgi:hypothetical protein
MMAYWMTYPTTWRGTTWLHNLKEKCMNDDARKIRGNIDSLKEIWSTMDRHYKGATQALRITNSRTYRYMVSDSTATRDFY